MTDEMKAWNLFQVMLGRVSDLKASVHIRPTPLRGKYEVDVCTDKKLCVSSF